MYQDFKVQCAWDIINCTSADEESHFELLKIIVTSWLDIKGFSYAKRWIVDYKIILTTKTKKKKSMRKELAAWNIIHYITLYAVMLNVCMFVWYCTISHAHIAM